MTMVTASQKALSVVVILQLEPARGFEVSQRD